MGKWIIVLLFTSVSSLFPRTRIIMRLDADVEFDLSLTMYPPLVFPTYYYPTGASAVNMQGINLMVGYQRIGPRHSISTMYLATRGGGDFAPSVGLDQLYFAPDGEPLPPPGVDPPGGNWRPYSVLYQEIEQFSVRGPGLTRFNRPQDYIFKAEPDDESTISSIVIYYRLYGL